MPYGVIATEDQRMTGIEEKPTERYFVNAGIYVLEPEATVFPVREYWQDVGQKEDFRRANGEYENIFQE